jgi:NhaP-type Na+/H+ and K+/H+ antiporter
LTRSHIAALLARQVLGGAAFGIIGGYLLLALINRVEATPGLYPILALAGASALFGGAQTAGASGFLAAYLAVSSSAGTDTVPLKSSTKRSMPLLGSARSSSS